jgi:hypothetical protein
MFGDSGVVSRNLKIFLCAFASLRLIFRRAEVDQVHYRRSFVAGLRRRGDGA